MKKFYFSFGYGTTNRNNFVCVEAEDYGAARQTFCEQHGDQFAFQYTEEEFAGQAEQYGLTEVPIGTKAEWL